ncbi:hypothetical protein VCRA219O19_110060 [Vibrio crassostreae]|nr:hypothetical protein VCRA219O19_110060 [Vibrio crassostreae]
MYCHLTPSTTNYSINFEADHGQTFALVISMLLGPLGVNINLQWIFLITLGIAFGIKLNQNTSKSRYSLGLCA